VPDLGPDASVAEAPSDADARRALVLLDRPLVVDLIRLTLNHGPFVVRAGFTPIVSQ
jgi:hypothetical protein